MEVNLPEIYLSEQRRAKEAFAKGLKDFEYGNLMAPVLRRIVKDLEVRKLRKFGPELLSEINAVQKEANRLLNLNVPYKQLLQFIFRTYLPFLDELFLKRHPEYKDRNYHCRISVICTR
ncbi:MAG: hypothetical protein K2X47_19105 [Bdellovibrionales bacterium]|nr:hypothetical protein [Bdellovibrionales bacterium]